MKGFWLSGDRSGREVVLLLEGSRIGPGGPLIGLGDSRLGLCGPPTLDTMPEPRLLLLPDSDPAGDTGRPEIDGALDDAGDAGLD